MVAGEPRYVCPDNATFVRCIKKLHKSTVELDVRRRGTACRKSLMQRFGTMI